MLGLHPLLAHCHLGIGVLSQSAGTRQEARERIRTAARMSGEMDTRLRRERAETDMRERP